MPKFKFRLATLERLREAARDQRRAQLAEAQRIADDIQRQIDDLATQLEDLKEQQLAAPGPVDIDRLMTAHRYEMVLRVEQQQAHAQRATVEAEVERRRSALVEADREVRTLEKLREKQRDRFRIEQELASQKQMDEVAARLHDREPPA
jgi:flagellar FliJ protein